MIFCDRNDREDPAESTSGEAECDGEGRGFDFVEPHVHVRDAFEVGFDLDFAKRLYLFFWNKK